MMRTIIDLRDEQIDALVKLGKRAMLSRAELVRRAVTEYLERHASEENDATFGLWKQRGEDGLTYQRRLRDEWGE